jgi:hypothetical protein
MLRNALLAFAVLACGDNIDEDGRSHGLDDQVAEWLTSQGATRGVVYRCESGAMCLTPEGQPATEEWCWDGREVDLEALIGGECHEIGIGDRLFPALAGCAYKCPPLAKGCNAHCSCACPTEDA